MLKEMKKNINIPTIFLLLIFIFNSCYKEPVASFSPSATNLVLGESVTFTNTSQDMDHCEWLFGDGGQSTKISPTYTYKATGTFEVTLRVFSKKDMKGDIAITTVTVDVNQPVASFTVPSTEIFLGTELTFTNTSQNMYRCEWEFGDGATSTLANPVHTYASCGTYDVNLRVYSAEDKKNDVATEIIEVDVSAPIASFTMNSSTIVAGEAVTFTNTSQNMYRCEWDFGDGDTTTTTSPVHTFEEPGSYKVNLRVFSQQDIKNDIVTAIVTVTQPTTLLINVYDFSENALDNCLVTLYATFDDWNDEVNPLVDTTTDDNGRAVFTDIDPGLVYIDVYKKVDDDYFYCNWFIQYEENVYKTTVVENKINEVDVYAYYSWYEKKVAIQMTE